MLPSFFYSKICCNNTILGGFLGLLSMLFISNFTNHISQLLCYESQNHNYNAIKEKNAEEKFASSLWCTNRFDGSKLCTFKNLYYIPDFKGNLLFVMNGYSFISGVADLKQLSLSTVQNHTGVSLKIVIIQSVEFLLSQNISFIDTDTFILNRFKSDNIMHVLHDDLLPLFVTYKELCSGDIVLCVSFYRLIYFDYNDHGPYYEWYKHFSAHEPIVLAQAKYPLCIRRGVFGLSNSSVWFQYGFKTTQGPLLNKYIDSVLFAEFTEFITHQFGITTKEVNFILDSIVFFSRKINRKLLSEDVVEMKLKQIAKSIHNKNINILNLDLSTNNSFSIIESLRKSQLLVGIHGSAMILAIFMQPGSHIIEIFPFGIQPEFVSPVRALCMLQNVNYHYESWVNTNELNTVPHPEYPPLLGGISHLEDKKKNIIMSVKQVPAVECCHNPIYLFRMFQDTILDDSFYVLFHNVVSSYTELSVSKQNFIKQKGVSIIDKWYFPPPVFNLNCKCYRHGLHLVWKYPFIYPGIEFNVATSNGILATTKETNFSVATRDCGIGDSSNPSLGVWVKAVDGDKDSLDSYAQCVTTNEDVPG